MPRLVPTKKFILDLDQVRGNATLVKKVAKSLVLLETNPLHPGLHLERIVNDPSAWSARVDNRYRISLDPSAHHPAGNPDWSAPVLLLRLLDHDDLYRRPR